MQSKGIWHHTGPISLHAPLPKVRQQHSQKQSQIRLATEIILQVKLKGGNMCSNMVGLCPDLLFVLPAMCTLLCPLPPVPRPPEFNVAADFVHRLAKLMPQKRPTQQKGSKNRSTLKLKRRVGCREKVDKDKDSTQQHASTLRIACKINSVTGMFGTILE